MSESAGYFDYNATTPMNAAARRVWLEAVESLWQNPSSLYREAGMVKQRLEDCRETLADHLGIEEPDRIVFTSGATEANNAVIRHLGERLDRPLALSAIEHPCVEAPAAAWSGNGRVREIPVDPATGVVDLDSVSDWIRGGEVGAVSVMAANNETGVCQPWLELATRCREHGVWFHTDAAQWLGKRPASGLGECDFVTGSGHKFGGGKGVGFLVLPEGVAPGDFHVFTGGPQEEGRRAGTENLPAVLTMVTALGELPDDDLAAAEDRRAEARDAFEGRMGRDLGVRVLGASGPRLWNTSLFEVPHDRNLKWLTRLSRRGFSVSTGSACSAGKGNPSRVMAAMGLDYDAMGRVIRVSGGWESGPAEWEALADAFAEVAEEMGSQ